MTQTINHQPSAVSRKVRRSFSRAAVHYEQLATLQQSIGFRLLKAIAHKKPQSILDIGMGTGWLTENLCAQFPNAEIVGMDFAEGMIECARKKNPYFRIVQADAGALPFRGGTFDMAISNLTYQWVDNLGEAFGAVYKTLKKNGFFYLTSFGPKTLHELFLTLEKCTAAEFEGPALANERLAGKEDITNTILKSGFCDFHVTTEIFRAYFPAAAMLLKWLKTIGANASEKRLFIGKKLLADINNFYAKNFSDNKARVYATFEVVWARAKK